ncbi:MAG: ATP-binding protein [Dysosmobacter sp.]
MEVHSACAGFLLYLALAKREDIPFRTKLDLPESLPIDEVDMCLVLSNLLENALEASLRTAPARRQIEITAYVHAKRLLLIEVVNAFDGKVNEKNGVFLSSKRKESGIGIQAVNHIAEKKRRYKYVYPSEWRFLRQSHALWISGNP